MAKDRITRVMLVVIALLLAANLVQQGTGMFATPAVAQVVKGVGESARTFDVKAVRGYKVAGLKDVAVLGDGKSFVVTNTTGFMVYQLDDFTRP